MTAASVTVMVIFSKMLFWKLLDHNYIQSYVSAIARYIDKSILKDTLKLTILRTWIKIRANSFIKTWVNIKRKSTKVLWKLSLAEKYDSVLQNNIAPKKMIFRLLLSGMLESLAKLSKILVAICFFFSQTNLVFIPNLVFIDILGSFCQSTYLLIVDILRSLNFIQCLHAFLIKTSKILMRFNIIFFGFSVSKCSSYVLFSMKHSFLPTVKITHNNSLYLVQCRARALQFRRNFWCLIMASTKLR